jgi:uncharacterized protein DUF4402
MHVLLRPILLLALLAGSAPAIAQCRLCAQPTVAAPADALTNGDVDLQIETSLNFDRLILSGSGPGAVTIRADGSSGVEGSVLQAGPRAMVGMVQVHGIANRSVRVEMPRRIDLFSLGGGRMTLDDITSDLPVAPHLDAAGNLSFRFGGRLIVSSESDGSYRGDLPITVEYQ